VTLLQEFGTSSALDGTIDSAAAAQGWVGCIDDRVDLENGDVSLDGADCVVELLVRGSDELLHASCWVEIHRSVERGDGRDVLHGSECARHAGQASGDAEARELSRIVWLLSRELGMRGYFCASR